MNMNIENFKEEHFALYQIWHRGATTFQMLKSCHSSTFTLWSVSQKITLFWKFKYGAHYAKYSIWASI